MRVVSDTSPILNLAIIGQLDLLAPRSREIVYPSDGLRRAVLAEAGEPAAEG